MMKSMMDQYRVKLAGVVVEVSSDYPSTKKFCRGYLTDERPDFSISISSEDISFEREKSAREDELEGLPIRQLSDEYLEPLAVYRKIASAMLEYDTLLFHGSAISVDGKGYLFTAKSGTGKSTHTRLWREMLGEQAVMVNDDKPLLKFTEQGVMVCGTPWNGKHRLSTNISVPLKALCILERDETNHIEPIEKRDALAMLIQQSYRPPDAGKMAKVLALVDKLGDSVSLYRLGCNMEPEAAVVAYEGMKERTG